jgi:hypothetical protein
MKMERQKFGVASPRKGAYSEHQQHNLKEEEEE